MNPSVDEERGRGAHTAQRATFDLLANALQIDFVFHIGVKAHHVEFELPGVRADAGIQMALFSNSRSCMGQLALAARGFRCERGLQGMRMHFPAGNGGTPRAACRRNVSASASRRARPSCKWDTRNRVSQA